MSNMKREWDEQIDSELDKAYREAGITQETLARMKAWIENVMSEEDDGCGCGNCVCGAKDV